MVSSSLPLGLFAPARDLRDAAVRGDRGALDDGAERAFGDHALLVGDLDATELPLERGQLALERGQFRHPPPAARSSATLSYLHCTPWSRSKVKPLRE